MVPAQRVQPEPAWPKEHVRLAEEEEEEKYGEQEIPLDLQFTAPSTRANSNPQNLLRGKGKPIDQKELRNALERAASTERRPREGAEKLRSKRVYSSFIRESRQALRSCLGSGECAEDVVIRGQPKTLRRGSQYDAQEFRGSRFRGVSKNKGKWQVMVTLYHRKEYRGGVENETEAARLYDRRAILIVTLARVGQVVALNAAQPAHGDRAGLLTAGGEIQDLAARRGNALRKVSRRRRTVDQLEFELRRLSQKVL